jgi:hypothetical protein
LLLNRLFLRYITALSDLQDYILIKLGEMVMKAKNCLIVPFLMLLLCFSARLSKIYAECDAETAKQLNAIITGGTYRNEEGKLIKASADVYALYGYIDAAKVAAFSEDQPIKVGLNSKAVDKWNSLLSCSNSYVLNQIKLKKSPIVYSAFIKDLEIVNEYLQDTIQDLHIKYKRNELLTPTNKRNLETIKKEIDVYLKKTRSFFIASLESIINAQPYTKQWKDNVGLTLETIFPNYKAFFQSYEKAKKQFGEMTPQEIGYFLRITDVIKIGGFENIKLKEERAAQAFFEKLEKFSYRLSLEIEKQKIKAAKEWILRTERKKLEELEKMAIETKEIMRSLLILYPLPPTYINKLATTKDPASLIIFSEAASLSDVLQALKRNIDTVLKE